MVDDDKLRRAREELHAKGWVLPDDAVPLAQGGGGAVYRCYSLDLMDAVRHWTADASVNAFTESSFGFVDKLIRATPENAYAALKIAHRADARLVREVSAMQKVRDPHLVQVLARDESDQPVWFLMEYLDGGSLHAALEGYGGDARATLTAILPVAKALGRLHRANLIHRDVKTKNVFRRIDESLVLGDLGIVFEIGADRLTSYESPMSRDWTPRWRPADLDTPTRDVYMLARVIYAMLTGDKVVEPDWLNEAEYQLAHMFPEQRESMEIVDEFLRQHIVARREQCASMDGDAAAIAIADTLARLHGGVASQVVFQWGAGHGGTPMSGPNRSLVDVPVLIPSWARRIVGRARFYDSMNQFQYQFELRDQKGKSLLRSSETLVKRGQWSDEAVIQLARNETGWLNLAVNGDHTGILSNFILVAHAR